MLRGDTRECAKRCEYDPVAGSKEDSSLRSYTMPESDRDARTLIGDGAAPGRRRRLEAGCGGASIPC